MTRDQYLIDLWREWRQLRDRLNSVEAEITRMQNSDAIPVFRTEYQNVPEWLKLESKD